MIKKNTKIIFEDGENKRSEEMIGGMPLSKGEIIHVHEGSTIFDYEVKDKIIDCFIEGNDQIVNVTYVLRKKKR